MYIVGPEATSYDGVECAGIGQNDSEMSKIIILKRGKKKHKNVEEERNVHMGIEMNRRKPKK